MTPAAIRTTLRSLVFVLAAAVAPGCRAKEEAVDSGGLDRDGDGAPAAIDCDDENDEVEPDAEELCNGIDDDCDGLIDEDDAADAPTWYADADGDGFGGTTYSERACVAPSGWVADNTDCDDGDPATFPGAAENEPAPYGSAALCMRDEDEDGFGSATAAGGATPGEDCDDSDAGVHPNADEECDGVDTDCDGLPITEELDQDGDRYVTCTPTTGSPWRGETAVSGGGDCDDATDLATPGATEVCDGIDNDCDGSTDEDDAVDAAFWYLDGDGDGFGDPDVSAVSCAAPEGWVGVGTDCDDGDAATHPGADEVCDDEDTDQDCDGLGDESDAINPSDWYRDADGDGWADLSAGVSACNAPGTTWISVGPGVDGDCDDADAAVSPAGTEVCDAVDNDCDGDIDEDDADDASTWALDQDGDGYGDPTYTQVQCEVPSGFVGNLDDCDDTDASVNPAATESCNGTDDDCDGDTDEDDAVDAPTWYLDYDGDGAGGDTLSTVSCVAPSGYVESNDDCDDNEPLAVPGGAEVCNDGIADNDCDATTSCAFVSTLGTTDLDGQLDGPSASAAVGGAIAAIGDHDGDGSVDILVGSPGGDRVYVVPDPGSTTDIANAAIARWDAAGASDGVGEAVGGGDLNGDGYADLAIGQPGASTVAVVLGPSSGTQSLGLADALYSGTPDTQALGAAVALAGDVDGNGTNELVVGASSTGQSGAAWLLTGPVSSLDLSTCSTTSRCTAITTTSTGDGFATVVAGVGDLDADGKDELAVGAPAAGSGTEPGSVWILGGSLSGTVQASTSGTELRGDLAGDAAGAAVAGGGDLDGDGYGDLLVGAPDAGSGAGVVYLVRGPLSGPVDLAAADAVLSGSSGDGAGAAVAVAGDLDGDGQADVSIGGADGAQAWVLLGPVTASQSLSAADLTITASAGTAFGAALAGPGDVDGDGLDDLYIGSPGYDGPALDAGAVWLLLGVGP